MPSKTLLCPVDFSSASRETLDLALPLARELEARLVLLHVVQSELPLAATPDIPPPPSLIEDHAAARESEATAELDRWKQSLSEPSIQIDAVVRHGQVAVETLLEVAAEIDPEIIVMSSHGRRGFRRFLIGSVTEEVVRRSTCPTLVFRRDPKLKTVVFPSRVVAAVDFSTLTPEVLTRARSIASMFDQPLDLVYIVHAPIYPMAVFGAGPVQPSVLSDEEAQQLIVTQSQEHLMKLYAQSSGPEVPVRTCIHRGDAGVEIVRHAEDNEAGLIVLGSEGNSGIDRLLIGSVCDRVLRRAPCPVLVIPRLASIASTSTGSPTMS